MNRNPKSKELKAKRSKARYLIVMLGYTQKEAAAELGVSKTSMGIWAKKYRWIEYADKELKKQGGALTFFNDFMAYISSRAPHLRKEVTELWKGFLNDLHAKNINIISSQDNDI
ncbi:MAG: hypothetical protein ABI921_00200 [Panacibacter sp.]